MSISVWWYIRGYTTKEKNATPFSFRKRIALGKATEYAGYRVSDLVQYQLEDGSSVVVRPSGTEPKLKTYISVTAENREQAEEIEASIKKELFERIGK